MRLWIPGTEPENAGSDIGPAVNNKWLLSSNYDLPVKTFHEYAMIALGHVILLLMEALANGGSVGERASVEYDKMLVATSDFTNTQAGGNVWVDYLAAHMQGPTSNLIGDATKGSRI
jgi:hypothetical protein